MTITEFLLARVAEDEANAASWYEDWGGNMEPLRGRVLAECAAKRAIVADCSTINPEHYDPYEVRPFAKAILRELASVHADHPDFDPEWAP